jgi:hypothetical protein
VLNDKIEDVASISVLRSFTIYTLIHTTNKEENIVTIKANHDWTIIQIKSLWLRLLKVWPLSNNKEESMAVMKEAIARGSVVEE